MGKNRTQQYEGAAAFARRTLERVSAGQEAAKARLLGAIDKADIAGAKGLVDEMGAWHELETTLRLYIAKHTTDEPSLVLALEPEPAVVSPTELLLAVEPELPVKAEADPVPLELTVVEPKQEAGPEPESITAAKSEPDEDVSILRIRLARESFAGHSEAKLKSLRKTENFLGFLKMRICLAQACVAAERIPFEQERYQTILKSLVNEWKKLGKSDAVFPAIGPKDLDAQEWINFSGAYDFAFRAQATYQFALGSPIVSPVERIGLIDRCAAACACVQRMHKHYGIQPSDPEVDKLASILRAKLAELHTAAGSKPICWWKSEQEGGPKDQATWASASGVGEAMTSVLQTTVRSTGRLASLTKLVDLIRTPTSPTFSQDLPRMILECLDNGVGPTDKRLTEHVAPFRSLIQNSAEAADPRFARLFRKIAEIERKVNVRLLVSAEIVDEASEEINRKLCALKEHLAGKTVLMIGGNRCHAQQRKSIEAALGCQVDWPVLEEYVHIDKIEPHMLKADVVCMLVRWSRHSYKLVLDEAKRMGKQVAMLPRGVGVNTVVNDLCNQLLVSDKMAA